MKVGNEHIYKLTLLLIDGLALIGATSCSESSYIYVSKYMFMLDVWMYTIFFYVIMLYQVSGIISFHNIQEKINEYK